MNEDLPLIAGLAHRVFLCPGASHLCCSAEAVARLYFRFGNGAIRLLRQRRLLLGLFFACWVSAGSAQGLVRFMNTSSTLVSVLDGLPVSPPAGSYYFALLTAPVGTTDRAAFTFSGLYATNVAAAGRLFGGLSVLVPGWPAGNARAFYVCGWSADLGHDFNPAWLIGVFPGAGQYSVFGWSMIATGQAGGVDELGIPIPAMDIFGPTGISSGFSLLPLFVPPPYIMIYPASQSVPAGGTAVFYASGFSFSAYQWLFQGAVIPGATNPTLTLTNVQPFQAGTYTIIATGGPGGASASASATLFVVTAPFIVTAPSSRVVTVGGSCDLGVSASGALPLFFQWYFNAALLSGATSATLSLTDIQQSNAGAYSVVVTNVYGAVTSSPAMLTVTADPPGILTSPTDQAVVFGGDASFRVTATGSLPLAYQWFFNLTDPIRDATNSALELRGVRFTDAGIYTVRVSNVFGSVTSAPARLSVSPGSHARVLHSFTGGSGGSGSFASLVLSGTTLYGTTCYGGERNFGTVFKVETDGSGFAVLHSFTGYDGAWPNVGLILAGATLYGTTSEGGSEYVPDLSNGNGTVFRINTDGSGFSSLKSFHGYSDGDDPAGKLVISGDTLYGITARGGTSTFGQGTIFKINTNGGAFTVLRSLSGGEGAFPRGGLLLLGSKLYGTAGCNGVLETNGVVSNYGFGVVFKLNTDGSGFSVLKEFSGSDGSQPVGDLVASGSILYGATTSGGNASSGTIYRMNVDGGGFSVLNSFAGTNGSEPNAGVIISGNALYGTTCHGGSGSALWDGTVYMADRDGSRVALLEAFSGVAGAWPQSGLILSGNQLYGTAFYGGISNCGVVFALSVPAPSLLSSPLDQTAEIGSSVNLRVRVAADMPVSYEWVFNGTNSLTGITTNSELVLSNVQPTQTGVYNVWASNLFGVVASRPAALNVIPRVERRMVPGIIVTAQAASLLDFEHSPDPDAANWTAFPTVYFTNSPQFFFDLSTSLPAQRFYRASSSSGSSPVLDLHMVPAITLTGSVGSSVRLDFINQFGPVDAWATLSTVRLETASQLYLDTSAILQPARLYRIVPIP